MSNWPSGLPFTSSTVADSSSVTRDDDYWFNNVVKPISDALTALKGTIAWVAPTLTGGWSSWGSPYNAVSYHVFGIQVRFHGLAHNGSIGVGNPIFTLPVGLRPSAQITFNVHAGATTNGCASLIIDTSGRVYVGATNGVGAGSVFVSLEGVVFTAD
jgi:hypothetical protein